MENLFPDKKYIFIYSLSGSLLLTLIPLLLTMDQIGEKNFIFRLTDVSVLCLLVIVIFYSRFWLNIKWSKLTTPHKITYNFLFLF